MHFTWTQSTLQNPHSRARRPIKNPQNFSIVCVATGNHRRNEIRASNICGVGYNSSSQGTVNRIPTLCIGRNPMGEIAEAEAIAINSSDSEPFVGMEFESEESAKVFYDSYASRLGFIMRVDAFRRSMRDGAVVWRRLVCNKEGFRKLRPKRSENRKPRAITREGCKAMIVVKMEKTGKWVVTKFVKDHNHPLIGTPANARRNVFLSQTRDEKDVKIRELTAELQRERKRCAAYQEQLAMILRDMEEHSNHLARNIDDILQSVNEIESKNNSFSHS